MIDCWRAPAAAGIDAYRSALSVLTLLPAAWLMALAAG